jgi:FMN phosphatase YigB (HAD superfamily)
MRLVLFDIDGTLLLVQGAGKALVGPALSGGSRRRALAIAEFADSAIRRFSMTLAELEHFERVVLLATLGLMMRVDGEVSAEETELLTRIAAEIGDEDFRRARTQAAQFADADAILQGAARVTRVEAREVIFELLYDMAQRDTITPREAEVLDRLASTWALPQRVGVSSA